MLHQYIVNMNIKYGEEKEAGGKEVRMFAEERLRKGEVKDWSNKGSSTQRRTGSRNQCTGDKLKEKHEEFTAMNEWTSGLCSVAAWINAEQDQEENIKWLVWAYERSFRHKDCSTGFNRKRLKWHQHSDLWEGRVSWAWCSCISETCEEEQNLFSWLWMCRTWSDCPSIITETM